MITSPSTSEPTASSRHGGPIGEKFAPYLEKLSGNDLVSIDPESLSGVKYYAVYYSASWCPPCRAFTPYFVRFYNNFKPAHANFEVIFVSNDNSSKEMVNYMKTDKMPWPAVSYQDLKNTTLNANKWEGEGIPDLVLIDSDGHVLSDSFKAGSYIGPIKVVEDIRSMVPVSAGVL